MTTTTQYMKKAEHCLTYGTPSGFAKAQVFAILAIAAASLEAQEMAQKMWENQLINDRPLMTTRDLISPNDV